MGCKAIFILCCLWVHLPAWGQNFQMQPKGNLDSLKKALLKTNNIIAKNELNYAIGMEANDQSIGYWNTVLAEARHLSQPALQAKVLDRIGFIEYKLGDIKLALNYFEQSLQLATTHQLTNEIFGAEYDLANLFFLQNDIKPALDHCFKCMKIAEGLKDTRKEALTCSLLGSIYYRSGELKNAMAVHKRGLQIAEDNHLDAETGWALLDLGIDYLDMNDTPNARRYYLQSAKYARQFGDCALKGQIYNSLGTAYALARKPDSAAIYYQRAYNVFEHLQSKGGMASTLAQVAGNYFERGYIAAAKAQALKALGLAKAINFKGQIPSLALLLKTIAIKEHNYEDALRYYELYVAITDSVINEKNKQAALEKDFEYNLEKKDNANKMLAQRNEIQSLQLSKDRYLLSGLTFSLCSLLIISLLSVRQKSIKADGQRILLEQKLLRSQMTPHFIFNSLQAIQNFILKQDEKMSVKYLSAFVSLIRNVLENSRVDFVTLQQEISLLTKYLDLQQLRFSNRFQYKILVADDVDIDATKIPPMLSQPFIENAVEHGMHDIDSGGMITLRYSINNNLLQMEIIDNGYGIETGHSKIKQHQSLAIAITKERILLMNKRARVKTAFDITPAYPDQRERKGVRVRFSLPLNTDQ